MNLKLIEYKSLLVYVKRYLLIPIIVQVIILRIVGLNEDQYIKHFLQEVLNILFAFYVVNILFNIVEEHAYLFMHKKHSYFTKRLLIGYILLAQAGIVAVFFYALMVLLIIVEEKLGILGIVLYFMLRITESEFYAFLSENCFFLEFLYVILLMVSMNLLTFILYMIKDMG